MAYYRRDHQDGEPSMEKTPRAHEPAKLMKAGEPFQFSIVRAGERQNLAANRAEGRGFFDGSFQLIVRLPQLAIAHDHRVRGRADPKPHSA